jgi:hypothetical protein
MAMCSDNVPARPATCSHIQKRIFAPLLDPISTANVVGRGAMQQFAQFKARVLQRFGGISMKVSDTLTQAQLDYLFRQLGYRLTEVKDGPRVWKNLEYDAIMLLPEIAPEQPARPHYLLTLRRIAIEKGIVEPEVFDALLEKARQHQEESVGSQSA